jgi:hypothetical protein
MAFCHTSFQPALLFFKRITALYEMLHVVQARYLVFDGDVDAVWVENMNSVMDDNKLLTLPNGERIRVQNHCKLLFEVFDLQFASPATISRCGMVYVDSRNLGYKPYIWTWLNSRKDEEEKELLKSLFEKYAAPCVSWVLEGIDGAQLVQRPCQSIPITNLNMMHQLTTLLDALRGPSGSFKDSQVGNCAVCSACMHTKSATVSLHPVTCDSLHLPSGTPHYGTRPGNVPYVLHFIVRTHSCSPEHAHQPPCANEGCRGIVHLLHCLVLWRSGRAAAR